jgi:hypothetical protein
MPTLTFCSFEISIRHFQKTMQLVQDHHPASMEAVTADVMVTAGFQEVWDFMHKTFSCVAISA